MRIVVIGAVAAGTSAASQAKRRQPDAEVVLLEQGRDVSYAACGLPYNIADEARTLDDLVAIPAHDFREKRKIDLRTEHQVLAIEPAHKRVRVRDIPGEREYTLDYDKLVIATGASAAEPKLPGLDLPGVFLLRTLEDGGHVRRYLAEHAPKKALLIGAGYIGMEMAESLRARGLSVCVLERAPQVLPGFVKPIADLVKEELVRQGVRVLTGSTLERIERTEGGLVAHTSGGREEADMVMVSVGVKPNVSLAKAAGIALGESGAIAVDDHLRTNVADVYAAGDCAEARHLVSGKQTWIPLGTTANKQGKAAGANAVGADERFAGIVGSAAFKVFDLEVGRTGLGQSELESLKIPNVSALSVQKDHANSYGVAKDITTVLFADPKDGKLLGAQMVGAGVVGKRIDVLATAITAGMRAEDVEALDLTYAPPIATVYDAVLIAATVMVKELEKRGK